jgi:catechol 2,3-dioxygenase-like lactoylglutathione lyase family enzyme
VEWSRLVPELAVADLTASLAFYADAVGFRVVHRRADPPFAYLDLGGAQVMVEQDHAGGWEAGPAAYPRGRGVNFQVEVGDLAGVLARLAAAGHALRRRRRGTPGPGSSTARSRRWCGIRTATCCGSASRSASGRSPTPNQALQQTAGARLLSPIRSSLGPRGC